MTNSVIERATSHFRKQVSGEMKKIHVPEWDCEIYFKTALTLREQGKLVELSTQGKQVEALAESLILKARNQDGSKMFTVADKATLLNEVDPAVIIRVVGEINIASDETDASSVAKN
jgi:hypothetical protein